LLGEMLCRVTFISDEPNEVFKNMICLFFLAFFFEMLCFRATSRTEHSEIRDLLFTIPFYLVLASFFRFGYKPELRDKIEQVTVRKQLIGEKKKR